MLAWVCFAAILLSLAHTTSCSVGDICFVVAASTVLLDDRFFFMSGNYSIVTYTGQSISPTATLNWLNVSSQFPVEENIPYSSLTNKSIDPSMTTAYWNALNGQGSGAMWNTNDTIYVFGGVQTPTNALSAYNVTTDRWQDVRVAGGDFNFDVRTGAVSVSVPESGLNFVLGGHVPFFVGGMVRFDASDPADLTWTNETLGNGSFGEEVPNLDSGALVYVPAGEQGVLIAFGGNNVSAGIYPPSGWPYSSDYSLIYVYDIASHTWWTQEASGTMPSYIGAYCTGVAVAPDYSAFHITMYGGWSLEYGRSFEAVYVLSIPSFTWINVTQVSDQSNREEQVNSTIGRDSMSNSCQVYNGALLIELGGDVRSDGYSLTNGACSEAFAPMQVLDLSTYEWQTSFDPSVTYQVPPAIYDVIGGNASGGATSTVPQGGFTDPTLSSVLQQRVPRASNTSSSLSASGTSTTASSSSKSQQNEQTDTDVGAIAGGVVGGVVGLAAIASVVWLIWHRRRNDKQAPPTGYTRGASSSPTEMEATHLNELHGHDRLPEADTRQVYEMPDTQQTAELNGHALRRTAK